MQTGQWESASTVKVSIVGQDLNIPARTVDHKQCIRKDEFDNLAAPRMRGMDCEMLRKELIGKTLHIAMTCTGERGNFTREGGTTFPTRTSRSSHHVMTGKRGKIQMKMVADAYGERTTACGESSVGRN